MKTRCVFGSLMLSVLLLLVNSPIAFCDSPVTMVSVTVEDNGGDLHPQYYRGVVKVRATANWMNNAGGCLYVVSNYGNAIAQECFAGSEAILIEREFDTTMIGWSTKSNDLTIIATAFSFGDPNQYSVQDFFSMTVDNSAKLNLSPLVWEPGQDFVPVSIDYDFPDTNGPAIVQLTQENGGVLLYYGNVPVTPENHSGTLLLKAYTGYLAEGPHSLTLCGTMPNNAVQTCSVVSVFFGQQNHAPHLEPIGDRSVPEGGVLQFQISAADEDGDALTFEAGNLPAGASFDSLTRTFVWAPDFQQAGTYPVLFGVKDDGSPPLGDSESVTITVGNVNRPPSISTTGDHSINEGETLSFTVSASDPDGDEVTLGASNLPPGCQFSPTAGTFEWAPSFEQGGQNYAVRFTATDTGALSASTESNIAVGEVNRPPVLDPVGSRGVDAGTNLSFTVTGSDPDGDTLSFSAARLPAGASLTGQTFSWTPEPGQVGNHTIEFTVQDDGEPPEVDVELVTITVGSVNRAPVFSPVGTMLAVEGQPLKFSVQAVDSDGDALTYSASALPEGAVFDASARRFSWTPEFGAAGSYSVVFYASDDGAPSLTGETTVFITVDRPPPAELTNGIVEKVLELPLEKGVRNSYVANIKKVTTFIANGQRIPAINQLNAFASKARQDMSVGLVPVSEGNELLRMASELIGIL